MVKKALQHAVRMPWFGLGLLLCILITANALLLPFVTDRDPTATSFLEILQPPSLSHLFGTDELGRDVFVRVLFGLQSSWIAACFVIPLAAAIGTLIGTAAAWFGGWLDFLLMRVVDAVLAFPVLISALAIAAILGPSLTHVLIALSVGWWTWYARVARGATLSARSRGYVVAAQAMNVPTAVLLRRHILGEVLRPIIVLCALDVGLLILVLGGLSFLGAGSPPPAPELGLMVSSGLSEIFTAWWAAIAPAAAIFLTSLSANLMATGLRDLLNVQNRTALFHAAAVRESEVLLASGHMAMEP